MALSMIACDTDLHNALRRAEATTRETGDPLYLHVRGDMLYFGFEASASSTVSLRRILRSC
jgi:hypothetical protein